MFAGHICAIFLYLFIIEKVICQESDCSIPDGSVGVCVSIDECPSIKTILANAVRPLPPNVVDILNTHRCGFESDTRTPKVCCKDYTSTTGSGVIDRLGIEDASAHPNLDLLPRANCGDILGQKLSNGNKTDLFEYPWMALLRYDDRGQIKSLCAGSLISEWYVLTAAHCVTKLKSTITLVGVRLGEYDTSTEIDCQAIGNETTCAPAVQDIAIGEVIAHPMYDRPRYANDIALIRLAAPANMTPDSVRPICLPTTFKVQSTELKRVSVTGWGTTETQQPATVLLQALLPIVPNDICQTQFFKRSIQITPNQMCAGGEIGVDSCKGDSGGPLFYPATLDVVRMVQFGIISAGVSVCSNTNTFPGIYVRTAHYMRWILDQMRP